MDSKDFLYSAINAVCMYFNSKVEKTDDVRISPMDVYTVWMCKTLQNCKGLFSTNVPDGMYYEVTYNGDKDEMYLDAYKKWENIVVVRADKVEGTNYEM